MKTVTLEGPFTDADLAELMQTLRKIEQRQPQHEFSMLVDSNDNVKAESLKEKLLNMFPGLKDQPVEIRVLKQKRMQ